MKRFDCLCGHDEDRHNFDPDSSFFGCCERFLAVYDGNWDKSTMSQCMCNEFRPDTLKYVEEAYARTTSKRSVHRRNV